MDEIVLAATITDSQAQQMRTMLTDLGVSPCATVPAPFSRGLRQIYVPTHARLFARTLAGHLAAQAVAVARRPLMNDLSGGHLPADLLGAMLILDGGYTDE